MSRAAIAFDRADMVGDIGFVFGEIGLVAAAAVFFVHPGNYPQSALGTQAELFAKIGGLHGDGYTRGVINRAGAEIPGIEMAGDDDDLLGMLAAFEVGDHVVADGVGKHLRSENELHGYAALLDQVGDEVGIFRGDGSSGNAGRSAEAGVRQPIVRAAHGANERSCGTESFGGFSSFCAIGDGAAVSVEGETLGGKALVELFVEEHDAASDLVAAEGGEFVEIVYNHQFGG